MFHLMATTLCPLQGLRGNSVVLMGKNTMMKRSIRIYVEETGDEKWSTLLEQLVGNVGLIFTKGDLSDVREQIESFKVRKGLSLVAVPSLFFTAAQQKRLIGHADLFLTESDIPNVFREQLCTCACTDWGLHVTASTSELLLLLSCRHTAA